MARSEVEVATEAVRVIGDLLTRPNEINRSQIAQQSASSAMAAAQGARLIADSTQTRESRENADIAESLASTAQKLARLVN